MYSELSIIYPTTSFKKTIPIAIDYRDSTTAYNFGGTYNSEAVYNNGLDVSGRFSFDCDLDLYNTGDWQTATLIDGTSASEKAVSDSYSWRLFRAIPVIPDGSMDSNDARLRVRVKNNLTGDWSNYTYFNFSYITLGYPFFKYITDGAVYLWAPSSSADYPTPILNINSNTSNKISVRGNVETIKFARDIQRFELTFPSLTLTDINNFKTFLSNIDYKKNTFRYYMRENNPASPFDNTWTYINCKIDDASINASYERNGYYSLTINLRKCYD